MSILQRKPELLEEAKRILAGTARADFSGSTEPVEVGFAEELSGTAFSAWNMIRGGSALVMGEDGSFLMAGSVVHPDKLLQRFINGERTSAF